MYNFFTNKTINILEEIIIIIIIKIVRERILKGCLKLLVMEKHLKTEKTLKFRKVLMQLNSLKWIWLIHQKNKLQSLSLFKTNRIILYVFALKKKNSIWYFKGKNYWKCLKKNNLFPAFYGSLEKYTIP